jgi:hypothetical protein
MARKTKNVSQVENEAPEVQAAEAALKAEDPKAELKASSTGARAMPTSSSGSCGARAWYDPSGTSTAPISAS